MTFDKIRKVIILGAIMLICFAAGSYASDGIEEVKAFLREDFKIVLDGRTINLENAVLIQDNNSYLPLRELGLMLNVDVDWNDEDRTVILTSASDPVSDSNSSESTSSGEVEYPRIIKFDNVINYKITNDNKVYNVL